ncbi:WxL domain-containing protein [Brochothrix campestris]|uniref:WxL domain-containing protein n=1 Tax=Brochothrix campestris TaxID=2757 RepID=UPI000A05AA3E
MKDSRGSDRQSWSLTVKQDGDFTTGADETAHTLKGAELTYSNLFFAQVAGAPTASAGAIVLGADAQEIASADAETGSNQWSLGLGTLQVTEDEAPSQTNGVTLTVPKGTVKNTATYNTSVTYELTADATK